MDTDARDSARRFALRIAALPEIAREALATPVVPVPFDPLRVRRILVTGIGSSEAHARLLAGCLADALGMDARFIATGALRKGPPAEAARDALIVFSQGLSPNARFALVRPDAWAAFGLATATVEDPADPERLALLQNVRAAGGWTVRFPPRDEYGTLVRVAGPLAGCIAAIRMARALGLAAGRGDDALEVPAARVVAAVERAPAAVEDALRGRDLALLDAPVGFLASGGYAELLHNLRLKWLETLWCPLPPAWELLDFSHGPYQESLTRSATWIALTRTDAERHGESELLARLESMLDAPRHQLLCLSASLPGAWSLVEHEAQLDHLLLRALERRPLNLEQWPGKDADAALYGLAPPAPAPRAPDASVPGDTQTRRAGRDPSRRIDTMSTPELAMRLRNGSCAALIPLGATEQHGPHLPLATDTWIADALAERLCTRHPELVRLPTLAIGCSEEHASFPGTLSLQAPTLQSILQDLLVSLAAHDFERAFLFSAHGGNCSALARALPALRAAAKPLAVAAFTDLARLAALQHRAAAALGIEAAAAGHHAGEFETSILLGLAPQHVRREALAAGLLHAEADAQALFYPDLRAHSESGVVGDPRGASEVRAEPYLAAWTDLLDEAYRAGSDR